MALPPGYGDLLNDLNRDIIRAAPGDPLQFCASWFNLRLEQERTRARATRQAVNSLQPPPSQPQLQHPRQAFQDHCLHSQPPPAAYPWPPYQPPLPPTPPGFGSVSHHLSPAAPAVTAFHYHYPYQPAFHRHPPHTHYHPHPHHHPSVPAPVPIHPHYPSHSAFGLPAPHLVATANSPFPGLPLSPPRHHHPHAQASGELPRALQATPFPSETNVSSLPGQLRPSPSRQTMDRLQAMTPASASPAPRLDPQASPAHGQLFQPPRPPSSASGPPPSHSTPKHHVSPASPAPTYFTQPSASPRASNQPQPRRPVLQVPEDDDGGSDGASSDGSDPEAPAAYNYGRRISVSAESLSPSNFHTGPPPAKVVIPKTAEQRARIEASIRDNLLFRNLDEEQYDDVLNAMAEVKVAKGTEVIQQGAVGDFFYVVEQGTFDVHVRGPPSYTYVPPNPPQTQGPGSLGTPSPANTTTNGISLTNPFASAPLQAESSEAHQPGPNSTTATGTTLTTQGVSKKVHSYGPGGSFGELALMYNAPRAATVVATSDAATLWALDRVTFRSILMEHTSRKRKMYEKFLGEVPILMSLSSTERSKIADSLEERSFNEGDVVIREGEAGRDFFIIESGRAEVSKKRSGAEEIVGTLGKGDHFGELALLNSAPRAATVRAAPGSSKLKVAALGEKAFTRLLGPILGILSRHAESHYQDRSSRVGGGDEQGMIRRCRSGEEMASERDGGQLDVADNEVQQQLRRIRSSSPSRLHASSGSSGNNANLSTSSTAVNGTGDHSFANWTGLAGVALEP